MKKIISLSLVVLMLFCIVPMNVFAGDTIVSDLPGYHTRYAEFHIVQNGGHYNANSGAAITNGSFYTAANGLNIPDGYTGNIVVYVYQATNSPADAVLNHYVGVVYTDQGTVSDTFYPLGDLMAVIYRSMEKDGQTLANLNWVAYNLNFIDDTFLTATVVAGVFATPGTIFAWNANWEAAACVDHVFGTDGVCTVCGEQMQDTYVVGDYTYRVIGSPEVPQNMHGLGVMAGWAVYATDKTQSSYGEIRSTLHGFPVTLMYKTFDGCTNMTVAPAVPENVQVVYNAYKNTAITETPEIASTVTKLYGAFKNCKNLTTANTIPASVTDMTYAFKGCSALTAAPDLSNVKVLTQAFDGCTALTGNVVLATDNAAKAFRGTNVTSITIKSGVTQIAQGAFNGCTLDSVSYEGTGAEFANITVNSYNGNFRTVPVSVNVADTPSVVATAKRTYVCDLDNVKDFFLANGTHTTYRQVKNNLKFSVTSAKMGETNVYTYGAALAAGDYTLCVRYKDGTSKIVNFTVA